MTFTNNEIEIEFHLDELFTGDKAPVYSASTTRVHLTPKVQKKAVRMKFTIADHIESEYGYYSTIGMHQCAVCTVPFPAICDEDPGSTEAAIGVRFICSHPECNEIAGGGMIICGTDLQELLEIQSSKFLHLADELDGIMECDGMEVDLWAIADRRSVVANYLQELGYMQEWGNAWDMDPYGRSEDDHWDSDTEKWNNYWSDYNQCGIHVSY